MIFKNLNVKRMILITALITSVSIGLFIVLRNTPKSLNQVSDYNVDAIGLLDEFSKNSEIAKKKYYEKVVEITGIVNSVETVNGGLNIALSGRDEMQTVSCNIDSSIIDCDLYMLNGNLITVKGRFGGYRRRHDRTKEH